jgi:hypothetical protein
MRKGQVEFIQRRATAVDREGQLGARMIGTYWNGPKIDEKAVVN